MILLILGSITWQIYNFSCLPIFSRNFAHGKSYIQTLALWAPCYYRHPAIVDKSQFPHKMHTEMTEKNSLITDSHYYKMWTFSYPPMLHFTCFFTFYSGHLSTSSKILSLTHILGVKMKISCLWLDLFLVHEATLETYCLHSYISFHKFRDKTIFSLLYPAIGTLAITDTKSPP